MKSIKYILSILLYCAAVSSANAKLKLADALQSNMVVQQNKAFKVWGTASASETISVKADWMSSEISVTANAKGMFLAVIDVPKAKSGDFRAHEIKISGANENLVLSNLLIGDLWLCSGQSNMQFGVKEMIDANKVISEANQPHIRLLSVGLNFSATPIETFSGQWQICSSETVKGFSAVGYTFGKKLYDELNIPIGLIFSGIGASAVQAYLPQDVLAADTLLNRTYLEPYLNSPKSKEVINGGFSFEKVVRPFLLYNAMINPLINLSINGICWYQGEANHFERESYTLATQRLITTWRDRFKQGELPFYYVQIAPFYHEKEDTKLAFDAFFREAQEKVSELNNTEMVSTMDVGEAKDLHPKDKRSIGLRLAAVALNRKYNQLNVPYKSPTYHYVLFDKKTAIVHFKLDTLGGSLVTKDSKPPMFFFLAGADQVFYPADAEIKNDTVILTSKNVKMPIAVRYAFFNYPVTNLQNKAGFPVMPFRTDNWQEQK